MFRSFHSLTKRLNHMTEGAFADVPAFTLHLHVPLSLLKDQRPKVGGNKYVFPVQGSSIFKPSSSNVYIFLALTNSTFAE